ncbi:hypothetical protein LTR50_004056 [Elasticomyces elasticus]|nr:hypothetical protein LTR50_004056 [Elasticomyces elasticus]
MSQQYTEHFLRAMDVFKQNSSKNPAIAQFDIRAGHSWAEVLEVVGQAQETYQSKAKGFRGFLPKVGRRMGELTPAIDPVLNMLPNGDYTGIVSGGVKLIFLAFSRMSEVRQKVLSALADAPLLLEQTEAFLRIYPLDQRLNEKAIHLYIALIVAIEGMIKWFDHRMCKYDASLYLRGIMVTLGIAGNVILTQASNMRLRTGPKTLLIICFQRTWDRIKVLAMQGLYGRDLDDKIDYLRQCAIHLRERAETCDKENTVQILDLLYRAMQNQQTTQKAVIQTLDVSNDTFNQLVRQTKATSEGFLQIEDYLNTQAAKTASGFSQIQDILAQQVTTNAQGFTTIETCMNTLYQLIKERLPTLEFEDKERALKAQHEAELQDTERRAREAEARSRDAAARAQMNAAFLAGQNVQLRVEIERARTPVPALSQAEALRLLGVDATEASKDIDQLLNLARALHPGPELSQAIITSAKFGSWFASAKSQMLFVFAELPISKVSPMTNFAASFGRMMGNLKPAIRLAYYADRHSDDCGTSKVARLVASLVAQLLATRQFDLTAWSATRTERDHYEALTTHQLPYLCDLLTHLITSMPYGTIFCLIDSFALLERSSSNSSQEEEIFRLVATFSDLVNRSSAAVTFKVLILSPARAGELRPLIAKEDLLLVPSLRGRGAGAGLMSQREIGVELGRAERRTTGESG